MRLKRLSLIFKIRRLEKVIYHFVEQRSENGTPICRTAEPKSNICSGCFRGSKLVFLLENLTEGHFSRYQATFRGRASKIAKIVQKLASKAQKLKEPFSNISTEPERKREGIRKKERALQRRAEHYKNGRSLTRGVAEHHKKRAEHYMIKYWKEIKDASHIELLVNTEELTVHDHIYLVTIENLDRGIHQAAVSMRKARWNEPLGIKVDLWKICTHTNVMGYEHLTKGEWTWGHLSGFTGRVEDVQLMTLTLAVNLETELSISLMVAFDEKDEECWLEEMPLQSILNARSSEKLETEEYFDIELGTLTDTHELMISVWQKSGRFFSELKEVYDKLEKDKDIQLLFNVNEESEYLIKQFYKAAIDGYTNTKNNWLAIVTSRNNSVMFGLRSCSTKGDGPDVSYLSEVEAILDLSRCDGIGLLYNYFNASFLILNFDSIYEKRMKEGYSKAEAFLHTWRHLGIKRWDKDKNKPPYLHHLMLRASTFEDTLADRSVTQCLMECIPVQEYSNNSWLSTWIKDSNPVNFIFDMQDFIQHAEGIARGLKLIRGEPRAVEYWNITNTDCISYIDLSLDLIETNGTGLLSNYLTEFKMMRVKIRLRLIHGETATKVSIEDENNEIVVMPFIFCFLENTCNKAQNEGARAKGKDALKEGTLTKLLTQGYQSLKEV